VSESEIQKALAIRINLQIVISSIPSIGEDMDMPLSRWLDAVPLPPEMPGGMPPTMVVRLTTELNGMGWSAYGAPAGMIPKMADYFQKCGMVGDDLALINAMGEALEPNQVGSWIEVVDGGMRTGWQFREPMELARIAPHLGNDLVVTKLMMFTAKRDIERYRGFVQSVKTPKGSTTGTLVELELPGDTAAAQVALAAEGFKDLGGTELPSALSDVLGASRDADVSFGVELVAGAVANVQVAGPGIHLDEVAKLCAALEISYTDRVADLERMLGADGVTRMVYAAGPGRKPTMTVELIPGVIDRKPGFSRN
jgi:hypothetical protein